MKLQTLLQLPSALALVAFSQAASLPDQEYSEHLYLKPLPNHHLHADFNFTASTPLADYDAQHFRYFPRSLAQIPPNYIYALAWEDGTKSNGVQDRNVVEGKAARVLSSGLGSREMHSRRTRGGQT